MEKHILSKSTFIRGLQCEKSLYLYKNFIQLRDQLSPEKKAIFSRGNKVGKLAQKLFDGGIEVPLSKYFDAQSAVEKTKQLIENGTEIIYEAAFQIKGVLAILDILVKINNQWFAYEVKSSAKISNTYLLDASLQHWVITHSGLDLQDFSIITINTNYEKKGELNLNELFTITSVLKVVKENETMIGEKIEALTKVAESPSIPIKEIGEHCFSPYECDYKNTCWKNVPQNSVFELAGIPKSELFALYDSGIKTIDKISEKNNLDSNANLHLQSLKSNAAIVNKEGVKKFMGEINYPIYFVDFEIFMPAVPIFNQTKPYQHIPFQYSIHSKKNKNTEAEHLFFLAEQGIDTRKSFIVNLIRDLKTEGSILVYDDLMERKILNKLKLDFPEHAIDIDNILNRIVDLAKPFKGKMYYHHSMKNSYSIKNLLHSLNGELNFTNLNISSGSIAMIAFEQLQTETDMFKILEIREQLLEYSKMDTLAMVKVFEVLEKQIEN